MTAQTTSLQLMITLLNHSTRARVLSDHVHVIHMIHMGAQMRVCLVMTQRELMLNRSAATVHTHRGREGC